MHASTQNPMWLCAALVLHLLVSLKLEKIILEQLLTYSSLSQKCFHQNKMSREGQYAMNSYPLIFMSSKSEQPYLSMLYTILFRKEQ